MERTSSHPTTTAGRARAALSVVVCARDEEAVIERCLDSVAWADERLVVDSGSADATRELAAAAGAPLIQNERLGF
jgi:glycosyltransferase involved in cell wall biosynthesis